VVLEVILVAQAILKITELNYDLEIGSRNRRHEFNARFRRQFFSCRCTTSNVVDCLRAPESGVEFMALISGADF